MHFTLNQAYGVFEYSMTERDKASDPVYPICLQRYGGCPDTLLTILCIAKFECLPRNLDIPVVKYMLIVADRRHLLWEVASYITEVNTITGSWQEDYFWFQSRLHSKDDSKLSAIQDSGSRPWEMRCWFNWLVKLEFSNICHRNITWLAAIFITAVSNVAANKTWREKQLWQQKQTSFTLKEETSSADECRPGQHHQHAVHLNSVLHHLLFSNPLYVFLPST